MKINIGDVWKDVIDVKINIGDVWKDVWTLGSDIVRSGLVLWLDAAYRNSYYSGTTWIDMSGFGNNGTLTNGPLFDNNNLGSIFFAGDDDRVLSINNINITGSSVRTVSFWVYIEDANNSEGWVAWGTSNTLTCFEIGNWYSNHDFACHFASSNFQTGVPVAPYVNTWCNVSVDYDCNFVHYYVNGYIIGSQAFSLNTGNSVVYIGDCAHSTIYPFFGKIANVMIYNRVLSATEVYQNYTALKSRYDGIITIGLVLNLDAGNTASYPLVTGTTWYDISGYKNNGTLTNGPTFDSANGGSIVFDGSNDYVKSTSSHNITSINQCTISIWYKSTENHNTHKGPFTIADNNNKFIFIETRSSFNYFAISTETKANNRIASSSQSQLINGNWHNIIITKDGNSILAWIDGTSVSLTQNDIYGGWTGGSLCYFVGSEADTCLPYSYNNCSVPSVQVYNRTLSTSEVLQNFNALRSRYGL
jgi:hypothetical protein